jgi:hypothetical protein
MQHMSCLTGGVLKHSKVCQRRAPLTKYRQQNYTSCGRSASEGLTAGWCLPRPSHSRCAFLNSILTPSPSSPTSLPSSCIFSMKAAKRMHVAQTFFSRGEHTRYKFYCIVPQPQRGEVFSKPALSVLGYQNPALTISSNRLVSGVIGELRLPVNLSGLCPTQTTASWGQPTPTDSMQRPDTCG